MNNDQNQEYQAYLFDMDGTLVNSEPLKGRALALACEHYQGKLDYHIYQDVMGEDWQRVTTHFFKAAQIHPDLNEFNQHFKLHYQRLLKNELTLTKNAAPYLKHLKLKGYQLGVVSSAANWMLDQILEQLALKDVFDICISQEDVSQHKPHPEAYLLALEKLGLSSDKVMVFEDSYAGVSAAAKAGCDVIAIRHQFNANNNLSGARLMISDFNDIMH